MVVAFPLKSSRAFNSNVTKFLQNHLDGRVVRGKYLLFLTMSMEISHPLKW